MSAKFRVGIQERCVFYFTEICTDTVRKFITENKSFRRDIRPDQFVWYRLIGAGGGSNLARSTELRIVVDGQRIVVRCTIFGRDGKGPDTFTR